MIHHGDQQVQQDDDVDDGIGAEHEHAPKTGEYLDAIQIEAVQVDESEYCPE